MVFPWVGEAAVDRSLTSSQEMLRERDVDVEDRTGLVSSPQPRGRQVSLWAALCIGALLVVGLVVTVITLRGANAPDIGNKAFNTTGQWPGLIATRTTLSAMCSTALSRTNGHLYHCLEKCTETYTMYISLDGKLFKIVPRELVLTDSGALCSCWTGYGNYVKGAELTAVFPNGIADESSINAGHLFVDPTAYPSQNQTVTIKPTSCCHFSISVVYDGQGNMPGPSVWPPSIVSWTCTGTYVVAVPDGSDGCLM